MQVRTAARRLALDVLYEAEIRGSLPLEAFELRSSYGWVVPTASDERAEAVADPDVDPPPEDVIAYGRHLVAGVQDHQADIDELIATHADRWTIERMPVIDRNVVRIAVFELLWADDVPVPVAINEAVELAKALSTDDSGRFVNGLLGRIAEIAVDREER
ncbi:MAG: transcription antitermination factor NusB [Actinobacteria bacterium]|nr:transcription antitermination factor NusB [Actinomycetota bacterium]